MAALLKSDAHQSARSSATTASAVGSLQRRLTLAYCAFTSATLAVLLFGVMAVAFAAQMHASGLYRIAYSTELSQKSVHVTRLRQALSDGTPQPREFDAWLRGITVANAVFTTDAYAEFVTPDGTVLGRSESPRPTWAADWRPDDTADNMIFEIDGHTLIGAHVITRQEIESNTEIRSDSGELLGRLKTRYRFRNMGLLYWLAGVATWLVLVVITLGLGSLFGRWAARPLAQRLAVISHTTERWATGDFEHKLLDMGNDEIGRLSSRLNTMSEQLRMLMAQQQSLAATEERQRLARDLHDSVKQQVFATSMQLGALALALPTDASIARNLLHDAQVTLQATHAELASLIFALQPAGLQPGGLAKGLADLVDGWRGRGNMAIAFSASSARPVPIDVEHALFRVAQEAVVNAIRHSGAQHISVALRCETDAVTLSILDDGVGFDPDGRHVGLGLLSMHTRMREIGGTLTIQSTPGHGTKIVALWQSKDAA